MIRYLVVVTLFMTMAVMPAASAAEPDGATVYQTNCAACHGPAGEGIAGSFPPLVDNPAVQDAEFVRTVVTGGLSGPIEVFGVQYDGVMPPFASLSDAEITALIGYVQGDLQGSPVGTTTTAGAIATTAAAVTGSAERGEAIFIGAQRLDGGGPACIACHGAGGRDNLGGSTLGPDLTDLSARFGGTAGVLAVLANPPSPTMLPVFGANPFTDSERADLAAYFATTQSSAGGVDLLLILGVIGAVVLFGGMLLFRRSRTSYAERLRSGR
ncbi:MAG TPA: c-type cytochrome [Actinobacteria bacterium]|nr:cytochrome c-552 precursor [bacterium BMS3Bbin01]HDH27255.1 c-type cytochrome [Actinomycetota bacterium]